MFHGFNTSVSLGSSGEVWGALGSSKVWGGQGRSGELWTGPGEEVWGALDRSGEVSESSTMNPTKAIISKNANSL